MDLPRQGSRLTREQEAHLLLWGKATPSSGAFFKWSRAQGLCRAKTRVLYPGTASLNSRGRGAEPPQQHGRGCRAPSSTPGSVPTAALQTNPVLQRSRTWVPPAPSGPALLLQPAAAPDAHGAHIQSHQAARCLRSFSLVPPSPALFTWCPHSVPSGTQDRAPRPPLSLCFTRRDEHIPDTSRQQRLRPWRQIGGPAASGAPLTWESHSDSSRDRR